MNKKETDIQFDLFLSENDKNSHFLTFKKLYYHLYSNSSATRAERIIEDISKIILCKIITEKNGSPIISEYLSNGHTANDCLIPLLRSKYPALISNTELFNLNDNAIRDSFNILSSVNLTREPAHVVGEAFQALIGPRLRGEKGQFFTPHALVKSMVKIANPRPGMKILDPACGTGGFLVESFSYLKEKYDNSSNVTIIGIDKDKDLSRLTHAILEAISPKFYKVFNTDSLDIDTLKSSDYYKHVSEMDIILTNPPFGSKIGITSKNILSQYELGYQWNYYQTENRWIKNSILRAKQDPQLLFLELCVKLLKSDGVLGIVLPEGVFGNTNSGYVWDFLRTQGNIFALVDCPRTTFQPSTDTKTNVLFFKKSINKDINPQRDVSIAIALNCGHDRRGRKSKTDGTPYPDDFSIIGNSPIESKNSSVWFSAIITNPHYWVPRYYDASLINNLKGEAKKSNAEIISFSELIKDGILKIRKGNEVGSESYGTGDIPFVRTSDISNWEITSDTTNSISEEIYNKYSNFQKLKEDDILLVVDGRYKIGKTAILQSQNVKSVIQSHFRIITVNNNPYFSPYQLLYILNLPLVLQEMRNITFIQSTLGNIGSRLSNLKIPIPKHKEEWLDKTSKFETLIRSRAQLLREVSNFQTPEPEL